MSSIGRQGQAPQGQAPTPHVHAIHGTRGRARTAKCVARRSLRSGRAIALTALSCAFALAACAGTASTAPTSSPVASTPAASLPSPAYDPQACEHLPNLSLRIEPTFDHGPKPAQFQRFIVLHDTEVLASPSAIVDSWLGQGSAVAAHFVVGTDGSIVQTVPLDRIAHHAGYGDTGHNAAFGISDDGRDDMRGAAPVGAWAADYAMNAHSVGIEMVHVGGSEGYPQAQLEAVDSLIACIDAAFGAPSRIIDHKAWRSGNSDTSPEFAGYLANYQEHRRHAVP